MSKWRPTLSGCLYVIPDIHGSRNMLDKICARILPLRRTDGVQDKIIFLGDYIDRHIDSHFVLDKVIEIKDKYKDNVICLIGNHELLLLETIELAHHYKGYSHYTSDDAHGMWLMNGGFQTLRGYTERSYLTRNPERVPRHRIKDFIPQSHIDFLLNLEPYYETNSYIFVHAGCNPMKPLKEHHLEDLAWDRSLFNYVKGRIQDNEEILWNKTIIAGHNHNGPIIHEKYMMLDCGAPNQLLLSELNSMDAFMVDPKKNRMVKFIMNETVLKKPVFRRVT